MVRQYIGARYVPRFTGLYNAEISYEALDVADNGLGSSYIAKIPTPPNTPFSDTTHWALYGSSSGAVIELQEQINNMKDGSVEGSLQNQIDNIESEIGATNTALFHFPALQYVASGADVLSDGVGNCGIVEYNHKFYMVDCFTSYQMTHYGLPYLASINVTKIEKVFISHYHGDHCDGLIPLINSNIEIGEVILAPTPDMSKTAFWSAAHDDPSPNYNAVISAITTANIPYKYANNVPIQLDDGLVMQAYNTDVNAYYAMTTSRPTGNTHNESDEGVYADYNNLSTVYSFKVNNSWTYFLSDINYTAQENCTSYFEKASLITIPHHDHDTFVNTNMMNKLNPTIAVGQDTANQAIGNTPYLINRKAGKYLNAIGCSTLITFGDPIIARIGDNIGEIVYGKNHTGYYDFMLSLKDIIDWKLMTNPLFGETYELLDADKLTTGTKWLGGGSTHQPIAGYGFMITTIETSSGIKLQLATQNDADAVLYYRTAGSTQNYSEWTPVNLFNKGLVVTSGSNLNDYVIPGTYTCASANVASSLANSPITNSAFRLEVKKVGAGLRQIVTADNNTIAYHERGNAGMQGWGAWT